MTAIEHLQIRHTNDFHSHYENWPRVARFLAAPAPKETTVLRYDIGDFIDRQHPLAEATLGQAQVALLTAAKYDALTIGNNEGLVLPHDVLARLYDETPAQPVLANLLDAATGLCPDFAKPSMLVTTPGGATVAVIGLTAPYTSTYAQRGWTPVDPRATLDRYLPELRREADIVILLSHLGLPLDRQLAHEYPIDLILGAHTHHVLPVGEWHSGTLLAAAGRYGDHVGCVDITLRDGKITQATAEAVPTATLPVLAQDAAAIQAWRTAGDERLQANCLAQLAAPRTTSDQANDALRALQRFCPTADFALISTGMFLTDFPAGCLSAEQLHTSMPHAVSPMVITFTGEQLLTFITRYDAEAATLRNQQITGSGFRGKVFGEFRFASASNLVADQRVIGEAIDPAQCYRIVTLDHYRWLSRFPEMQTAPAELCLTQLLRELMADYYQEQ